MKRKILSIFLVLILTVAMPALVACDKEEGENIDGYEPIAPAEYTIQYSYEGGVNQITVAPGQPYAIDEIPYKTGYEFWGLYGAEVGGTLYVNKHGSSVSPFTDERSLVLYPQFKAKEYTVVLDYQGSEITGSRQLTVQYGSVLPELPKNLSVPHKTFAGWFTDTDKKGVQIADRYGLVPVVSVLNEDNFDLNNKFIYLYAGFEGEKYAVTFYYAAGMPAEEMEIEYGTSISEIVTETRVDGKAVVAWATNSAGTEIFNGKITEEKVLYAAEYAPVIDFDANGGKAVNSLVARAGSAIVLPTPKRDNYTFTGWKTSDGNIVNYNTMPADSLSLRAVWQANIVFNSNGGTEVTAISQATGTKITLPSPERSGYIFAGWYTQDKQQYTSTAMPEASITLKAGWYKTKTSKKVVVSASDNWGGPVSSSSSYNTIDNKPRMDKNMKTIDVSDFKGQRVRITAHFKSYVDSSKVSATSPKYNGAAYFSENVASDAYLIWTNIAVHTNADWTSFTDSTIIEITGDKMYISLYAPNSSYSESGRWWWNDFYLDIEYPDTSTLYL